MMQTDHRYPGLPEPENYGEAQTEEWVAEAPNVLETARSRTRVLTAMFLGALCTGLVSLFLHGGISTSSQEVAASSTSEAQAQEPAPEGEVSRRLREKTAGVASRETASEDNRAKETDPTSAPSSADAAKANTNVASMDYMAQTGTAPKSEEGVMANLLRAMDTLEGGKDD